MKLFPAIDIVNGKAVRLFKGDYDKMTIYSEHPEEIAKDFYSKGAKCIHVVDLEGAKNGGTPNIETIKKIADSTPAFMEVGGGIRSEKVIETYLNAGVNRVILGTSAVTDPDFLKSAIRNFGDKIAVGVDIKDQMVAIKGWTEKSSLNGLDFCKKMQDEGVKTIICTDISKDGAMQGTNRELYKVLANTLDLNIIASGGVSSIEDVKALRELNLYGAIIGKAYYTGDIDLQTALKVAK